MGYNFAACGAMKFLVQMDNPWDDDKPKWTEPISNQSSIQSFLSDENHFDPLSTNPFADPNEQILASSSIYSPHIEQTQLSINQLTLSETADHQTSVVEAQSASTIQRSDLGTPTSAIQTTPTELDSKINQNPQIEQITSPIQPTAPKQVIQEPVIPNPLFDPFPADQSPSNIPNQTQISTAHVPVVLTKILSPHTEDNTPLGVLANADLIPSADGPRLVYNEFDADPLGVLGANNVDLKILHAETLGINQKRQSSKVKRTDIGIPQVNFKVEVLDPLKVGDKLSGFVEYRVKTWTDAPGYRNQEFSVMRRFSDFLWLFNQLLSTEIGVVVPGTPEKIALGNSCSNCFNSARNDHLDINLAINNRKIPRGIHRATPSAPREILEKGSRPQQTSKIKSFANILRIRNFFS